MSKDQATKVIWQDASGKALSCVEKLKVLEESLDELVEVAQDTLEDAILMGVDEQQIRTQLAKLIESLPNPYKGKTD